MNILLINPPMNNMIASTYPSIVDEEAGYYPPLGLMYIAAYAERHTDNRIEILDTIVERMSYGQIEKELERKKPDIVGVQAMTFTLVDALLIAKIVKRIDNEIKVVLGGPHAYIYPNETINQEEIDYLVLGEGEISFTNLLENIDNIQMLKSMPGLVFKDCRRIINTGVSSPIMDLDSIPFPARDLTKYKKYYSLIAKRSPITTMMSSRGCPYNCSFCGRPHLGKKFRARSAKNVVDEIEECTRMGIQEFFFYDDTFAVNRQRAIDICKEILERGLDIGWDIRTRVDSVDMELLSELKRAGCERIHYGVESGNPEMLKIIKKGITIDQARNAFKLTKDAGIQTLAYFMFGLPGETKQQMLETIKFSKSLRPDYVHFSVLTPFPSTPIYEKALEDGVIKKDYWMEFANNPQKDFIPRLIEGNLAHEEMINLLKHAYKTYYINSDFILNQIFNIRSLGEFKRKAKAGLRLLMI